MRILVAEDDPAARLLLKKFLTARSFQVVDAADGHEALLRFASSEPDLVLLDINMPQMDGWSVLRQIRSMGDVPVIILTVRDDAQDKVKGLMEGADDYVTKPFDLREVEARIRAIMRRTGHTAAPGIRQIGPLTIDDEAKEVRVNDRLVKLSPTEYKLIWLLASRPGKVFSPEEIVEALWPDQKELKTAEDVKQYVYLLRGKLQREDERRGLIQTVRGFGYKLCAGDDGEADAAADGS